MAPGLRAVAALLLVWNMAKEHRSATEHTFSALSALLWSAGSVQAPEHDAARSTRHPFPLMLTYQVRPRVFRHDPGTTLEWPADCTVRFHLQPNQPFGVEAGGGRTTVRAREAVVRFDANTGQHFVTSREPLKPLSVGIQSPNRLVELHGATLTVHERVNALEDLAEMVTGLYFSFPPVLNLKFADPPTIARVDGEIGGVPFRWELSKWSFQVSTTTQQEQESAVAESWERLPLVGGLHARRLMAALHYFHIAARLDRASSTLGEFMAESILNFAKVLEVLFPPATRDAVREGLEGLGYERKAIERLFIPAMALRNEIDVGHVSLALLTREQLRTIHSYTEIAESAFRSMLDRVVSTIGAGRFAIAEYTDPEPTPAMLTVIERLQAALLDDS